MSESAGRVVAWLDKDEHGECAFVPSQTDGTCDPKWIPLVPEQLLVDCEADRDSWSDQAAERLKDWDDMRIRAEAVESKLAAVRALADELAAKAESAKDDLDTRAEMAYDDAADRIRA